MWAGVCGWSRSLDALQQRPAPLRSRSSRGSQRSTRSRSRHRSVNGHWRYSRMKPVRRQQWARQVLKETAALAPR